MARAWHRIATSSNLAEKQATEAQRRLDELQKAWNALAVSEPVESLQSEIDADVELRGKVEEQLVAAESAVAEYQQQAQDGSFAREQLECCAGASRASDQPVARVAARDSTEDRDAGTPDRQEAARSRRRSKWRNSPTRPSAGRLLESRATAGTHAEQLRIIDPGIVPQRPSSPNISLNVCGFSFRGADSCRSLI